jgi:Skp family chaperone for outer membrane proteins
MSTRIRLSLVAAASLMAVVLIALFVTQASPTAASADATVKIAVIDTEKILLSSVTGKGALASMKKLQETLENELKMMQQEIKDLQTKIQDGRQSLSQDQLAQLQKQLDDKLTALRRKQDDSTRDLNKKKDEVLGEIDKKVMPVLNQIGKEMGYTAIFRKFESGLIYADEAIDITAMVIQRLDTGATTRSTDTSANRTVGAGPASPSGRPDLFMVSPAGNVGIGTASPTQKLHISGAGIQRLSVVETGNNVDMRVVAGTTNGFVGTFSNHLLNLGTNNSNQMTILTNGRVGVGTAAPDQLFSVNGEASKVGGGSWVAFSDERLKNIKGNFNSGLRAVMQLQPLRYEYRKDNVLGIKSEGEHIGFGAKALERIIPEAVTKNAEGYLMVNNDPILWTMLNAIKEQQKEIADLKSEARKLQATSRRHQK